LQPRGETKKYIFCKGGIPKEFFAESKAKMTYFAGGKDLFTMILFRQKTHYFMKKNNF
jgi:hypothetical protein